MECSNRLMQDGGEKREVLRDGGGSGCQYRNFQNLEKGKFSTCKSAVDDDKEIKEDESRQYYI